MQSQGAGKSCIDKHKSKQVARCINRMSNVVLLYQVFRWIDAPCVNHHRPHDYVLPVNSLLHEFSDGIRGAGLPKLSIIFKINNLQ